jgi:signal transduction histidine kinase
MTDGTEIANQLLERLALVVMIWYARTDDPQDMVLAYANARARFVCRGVVIGQSLREIVQQQDAKETLLGGVPLVRHHAYDVAVSGHDRAFVGEYVWREERAYEPELLSVGPRLCAVTLHDVTDHLVAIKARKEDLRRTLYVLSHDLRKPSRHMIGFADAFAEDVLGGMPIEQAKGMLVEMKAAGQRLERLLDGILQFAQLGHVDRWEQVDLATAWHDATVDYVIDVDSGASLVPSIDRDLPPVYGSRAMIQQLLTNIVANAAKFCPAPVRVSLSARKCDHIPNRVCVEVRDNGPGIPVSQRDEVFTLFRRGRNAQNKPGMGLGLAVCRWIAEAHGGTIRIGDSEVGTLFVIELPSPPRERSRDGEA